jgi:hypothetical protein
LKTVFESYSPSAKTGTTRLPDIIDTKIKKQSDNFFNKFLHPRNRYENT